MSQCVVLYGSPHTCRDQSEAAAGRPARKGSEELPNYEVPI